LATGQATFHLSADRTELDFKLIAANIETVDAMLAGGTYVNAHTSDGLAPPGTGPGDLPAGESAARSADAVEVPSIGSCRRERRAARSR
jgi:hypothetical protein